MQALSTDAARSGPADPDTDTGAQSACGIDSAVDVRRRIVQALSPATFKPRPWRALWFIPLFTIAAASMTLLIMAQPAWYWSIALAVLIGHCMATMTFLAHEALHGSMMSSPRLRTFLGYLGLGPLGVSPTLWQVWHNQVHHTRTNMGDADPDSFGTLERYRGMPKTRFWARLGPGSRHWQSAFFFTYWFSFHAQNAMWVQSKYKRSFVPLNRRRAKLETVASFVFWAVIASIAGWRSLYVMIIPLMVANATLMSYIATNHFMRPQSSSNDPLENSMSVTTTPLVDRLHFHFSHHVEHHLFPRMSPACAPVVRAWLKANAPDRYVSPAHWVALAALYKTPRVYLDTTTLCDPEDLSHTVNTSDLAAAFAVGTRGQSREH
jgi:fatty acid desaturase